MIWEECVWKTAQEICGVDAGHPLTVNIDSTDIKQGSLGNCWLIAGISAVAEYAADKGDNNEDISSLFLTKEYTPNEPVDIKLWVVNEDTLQLEPQVFSVRDSFPTKADGTPMCAAPKDNVDDIWVMFLEAAFAMMKSQKDTLDFDAYKALSGGQGYTAMRHLTGITCIDYITRIDDGQSWEVHYVATGGKAVISTEHLWQVLVDAEAAGELMCAGTQDINNDGNRGDASDVYGVAEGHEYTLQKVFVNDEGVRKIQLRNPWGQYGEDPSTAKALDGIADLCGDGVFLLDFDTFANYCLQDVGRCWHCQQSAWRQLPRPHP